MTFCAETMERDLRTHAALCDELLALAAHEHHVLREQIGLVATAHATRNHQRQTLLARLDQSLRALRIHRLAWQNLPPADRTCHEAISRLISTTQQIAMKVIVLDRENERSLLRQGLLPARHIPPLQRQEAGYVASAYRRHG